MFCKNCGQQIDDTSDTCEYCGAATSKDLSEINLDNPSHLAGITSCCLPMVGIILYFMWKDEKPKSASLICKWLIGGVIIWLILYITAFIMGILVSIT